VRIFGKEHVRSSLSGGRGLIIQPGALGDCVLTLPLAESMKASLNLAGLDIMGHTDYLGILPGRSCVDAVCSIDMLDIHRLFVPARQFDLEDRHPMIGLLADYRWIVTFLGEPGGDFEQNLIFTANCSHSAEVLALPMKAPKGFSGHLSDYYRLRFKQDCLLPLKAARGSLRRKAIKPTHSDVQAGRRILGSKAPAAGGPFAVIHPGSGGADKCWYLENFLDVARLLESAGYRPVFLLGPAERSRFDAAKTASLKKTAPLLANLALQEVVGVLSCAAVYLGNDSGISHLAASAGVGTVAVFGPAGRKVYRPVGPAVKVVSSRSGAFTRKVSSALQRKCLEAVKELARSRRCLR